MAQPLTQFQRGSVVRIDSLDAGGGCRCRLCALGLTPGTTLRVDDAGSGPCRITVRGASLVLGHGMASKVLASAVAGERP